MAKPERSCPACGFSLGSLKTRFGAIPRFNKHTSDISSEHLSPRDVHRIDVACQMFGRRFPQANFSVIVSHLPHKGTVREFAFYLINRCQFTPSEARGEKNFTLLLLICPDRHEACITTGYGLERLLSAEVLEKALGTGTQHLAAGRFVPAAEAIIRQITKQLTAAHARQTAKHPAQKPAIAA